MLDRIETSTRTVLSLWNIMHASPLRYLQYEAGRCGAEFISSHLESGAKLFASRRSLHEHIGEKCIPLLPDGLFLEFGVYKGRSLRRFARYARHHSLGPVVGFDGFLGLAGTFGGVDASRRFDVGGSIPLNLRLSQEVRNGDAIIVPGLVQETLGDYLETDGRPLAFAHLDLDDYEPTSFVLRALSPRLIEGSLLLFDEFLGNPGWRASEFRAYAEAIGQLPHRFVAFGPNQALIQIQPPPSS